MQQPYIRANVMSSNSAAFDVIPLLLHAAHLGKHSVSIATETTLSSIPLLVHRKVFSCLAENFLMLSIHGHI